MRQSDSTRPVSGEIMMPDRTGKTPRPAERSGDVVDVDFETVVPLADEAVGWGPEPAQDHSVSGLDMLKADGGRKVRSRSAATPLFWCFGAALVGAAFWVSGGHSLLAADVGGMHGAPSHPLQLIDVTSRVERDGSQSMLIVDGGRVEQEHVRGCRSRDFHQCFERKRVDNTLFSGDKQWASRSRCPLSLLQPARGA
ncbi:hypothetical protein AB2N04_06350 [Nitratireductor sp. GISD-1A_MAKvit]|uniref:hypothetical protein n=1 Tax=Nitratireductor sp. GISD-1A_MAKvit TaxID=3234198 RepID=UPI003465E254